MFYLENLSISAGNQVPRAKVGKQKVQKVRQKRQEGCNAITWITNKMQVYVLYIGLLLRLCLTKPLYFTTDQR